MKCLSIQIQFERSKELNEDRIISELEEFCSNSKFVNNVDIQRGYDKGSYININCTTTVPSSLWNQIKTHFFEHTEFGHFLKKASIVTCEGNDHWNDYLLLHHYDEKEKLDTF